ncbi:LamB/YcsF family protein [Corynebacterium freiburgense]|uniref:LamB/YcsF family protein n=1 Tax=Corynebacterium freiburgense TaxID=556548 RepID=UPI000404404F|nr:5-oxoprolinase subunit PxpA [Corynebacterium freiburgense]WJZ02198.1 LamB/YcsF family protein [Corynebacterium freiburgense]
MHIDLNSDLGESFGSWTMGSDSQLLALVSSANVACGFHAGDPLVMRRTCAKARAHGVRIGAHPGYRDVAGFGRRNMDYDAATLTAETIYQVGALQAAAHSVGAVVEYVKPHGALYNRIARDKTQAMAVIEGILPFRLPLMGLAGSPILQWAEESGLRTIAEAFADRLYMPDGSLSPRSQVGSVLDAEQSVDQAVRIASGKPVTTATGDEIIIQASSICVHGDNPHALDVVRQIIAGLEHSGVGVSSGH